MPRRENSKNTKNREAPHARVKYEDPSLKFLDWVDHLGFERTVFGRMFVFLEEKFGLRRFCFVFLFTLILAYAISFEVKTPLNYQVGDVAKFDIVAPMGFEMVDEVTTEEKRLKAEATVPVIFDYDQGVFERVSGAVYRSFRLMRVKLKYTPWPKKLAQREDKIKEFFIHKGEFEKELGVTVPDYLFEWLVNQRFAARTENIIIRNLAKWYDTKIVENREKVIPGKNSLVLAKTLSKSNTGREFTLKRHELHDSADTESFTLTEMKGLEKASEDEVEKIQAIARLLVYPNLTLNKQEIATRKQEARETVLPITVSIKKNQPIVTEGTVIQPFHMAILKEIQTLRSNRRHDVMAVTMALIFLSMITTGSWGF